MELSADETPSTQATARVATVGFEHDLPVTLKAVTLSHRYGNGAPETFTWHLVKGGLPTGADLHCHYETGAFSDYDHWILTITFDDDTKFTNPEKRCYLTAEDESSRGNLLFKLKGWEFNLIMRSGTCKTNLSSGPNGWNLYSFFRVQNEFPVAATVELNHHYSNTPRQTSRFNKPVSPKSYTDYMVVYSTSGSGYDYWNIAVSLDIEAPANAPYLHSNPFRNANTDKRCNITKSDSGGKTDFIINPIILQLNMPSSGSCSDNWITPAGYNTVSFIKIKNNFKKDVRLILLRHQYSDDMAYEFEYKPVLSGLTTGESHMVEYNTGLGRVGYDYWNITVVLQDSTWYENSTKSKRCYLTAGDAKTLEFAISETTFNLNFEGGCTNGMVPRGMFDIFLGADKNRPYNKNCFLASHNAMANFETGYILANQNIGISGQLARGATALLLDVWSAGGEIYLLHGWFPILGNINNAPFSRETKLSEALADIAAFMKRFDDVVVTIIIEDRLTTAAERAQMAQDFRNANLYNQMYKPMPNWDTLNQMKTLGKRLVVFTSHQATTDFLYQWDYMDENVYGNDSLKHSTWLQKRTESKRIGTHKLFALNHFPTVPIDSTFKMPWANFASANSQKELEAHIDAFRNSPTRPIFTNFLQVDFFDFGWPIEATKYINRNPIPFLASESGACGLEDAAVLDSNCISSLVETSCGLGLRSRFARARQVRSELRMIEVKLLGESDEESNEDSKSSCLPFSHRYYR